MATPASCYADFCLVPVHIAPLLSPIFAFLRSKASVSVILANGVSYKIGTGSVSVANEVAAVQRVLQASGLKYTMHSAGTTVGEFFFILFLYYILSGVEIF